MTTALSDRVALLSGREREVLGLLAEGDSNERIAERLEVNARTVESHTSRIFAKLGLKDDHRRHRRVLAALAYLEATGRLVSR